MTIPQPLDLYPPGRIPAEALLASGNQDLEDLIATVQRHHKRKGHVVTHSAVLNSLDASAAKMGLTPAEGRGLFGKIWKGVKNVAAHVGTSVGEHAWNKFKEDPIGSLEFLAELGKKAAEIAAV